VKEELRAAHADIMRTMSASYQFFDDHPKEIQKEWMKYMRKIDQKVEVALRQTVKLSLQELSRAINGDAKNDPHALFKVNLILDEVKGAVEFRPTMSELAAMIQQVSRLSITTIQVVPKLVNVLDSAQHDGPETHVQMQQGPTAGEATSSAAHGHQSFYDVISNDDDILKILVLHNIETVTLHPF
jgi:dynein heavy chain